jgi:predicted Zn finger-like uncharacterized protein
MDPAPIITRCPHCQAKFQVKPEQLGRAATCPKCAQPFTIEPAAEAPPPAAPASGEGLCAICQSPIAPDEATTACPGCKALYHAECWEYNGGCAVYGCSHVPPTEHRDALEIPPAYWGKEEKNCPNCGQTILAAAVRCRHCGATFSSAAPQDASEFYRRKETQQNLPAVRRGSIWLLVFSAISCTAPIAAFVGLLWYYKHRKEIAALPALQGAICKIAVGLGVGQTAVLLVLCVLYGLTRGGT